MFCLCKFPESPNFVVFDNSDFHEVADSMELDIIQEINLEDYADELIVPLNDLIIRSFNKRIKTASYIADKHNISTYNRIKSEYLLIQEKKSRLSASERKAVLSLYSDIQNASSTVITE